MTRSSSSARATHDCRYRCVVSRSGATNGGVITLLTNDLDRTAVEIAALYKSRWQIELLFRWIKQHLDIRKFIGANDNAIRLQVLAAMIAYLLVADRSAGQLYQNAAPKAGRTRRPASVHPPSPRHHRQAAAHQPQPQIQKFPQPNGVLLWLNFPGQPCASGER